MGWLNWPNVHEVDPSPEPLLEVKAEPTGRARIRDPKSVRGYRTVHARDVKPSDIVIERYPE